MHTAAVGLREKSQHSTSWSSKLLKDISPQSTQEIYDTFLNPSSSKYAFVGAENKKLIFLNDLRWSQGMIPWQEFLNLLEGQSVHLAAPKTHYARDISITDEVPLFANSIAPIMFAGKSASVEGENAMMEARWQKFQLSVQIPLSEQKTVKAAQDASVNLCSWELMHKALSLTFLAFNTEPSAAR